MTEASLFENMSTSIETERKFLIRMPSIALLSAEPNVRIKSIWQTYLLTNDGTNARVRKIVENGNISFVKTVKKRISALSCYEDEKEITEEQYFNELKQADPNKAQIVKTRYALPCGKHIAEIDIYPFWNDRAILELELKDENESFSVPDFIEIVKEVSEDKRYKNTNLAVNTPLDEI